MSESLRKAIVILDALRALPTGIGVRALASHVDLPKSTVQRLLQTLEETQMVIQDPLKLSYSLGPRTLMLGTAYREGVGLGKLAVPIMTTLRDRTGETVGLSVAVDYERLFIEEVQSQAELRVTSELGRLYPLWSGAPGRILLLGLKPDELEQCIAAMPEHAAGIHATGSPAAIRDLLAEARMNRSARAHNETLQGISAIAAPVIDASGMIVAALSISGPSDRLTSARMDEVIEPLTASAARLNQLLGNPSNLLAPA